MFVTNFDGISQKKIFFFSITASKRSVFHADCTRFINETFGILRDARCGLNIMDPVLAIFSVIGK